MMQRDINKIQTIIFRHRLIAYLLVLRYAQLFSKINSSGNRLTKTEPDKKTTYSYDPLYRLTQALPTKLKGKDKEQENKAEAFSYDPVGNRLTGPRANDYYSYNEGNELLSDKKHNYEYDANGNLTSKTSSEGTTKYSYDYENRLTKVTTPNGTVAEFKYDPFGRRVEKKVESTDLTKVYNYVYDNEDIILEYLTKTKDDDGEGRTRITRYIHGLGIDEPLSFTNNKGETYFYHADGLGSIIALTDMTGNVAQTYEYDSFGNMKKQGNINQPYTYTGREYDKETGLYFYRARYYDAEGGIFTTPDPLNIARVLLLRQNSSTSVSADQIYNLALRNPQMLNEFSYATNNPLTYTDPYGEMSQIVGGVIAIGGTGALIGFTACMDNCIGGIKECQQRTEPMTSAQMQNYAKCAKTCFSPTKLWEFLIEPLGAIITTVIEGINH